MKNETENQTASAADTGKDMTIEEAFARLDETIAQLETENITLEDSLKAYEQGMQYIKTCNEAIDRAEKKVLVIRENGELDEF
ncbi:MAG: exodeoxyribonuclease VII small subunit [Lachnospiraceae bacterium]